jgi:hypothetical protein
MSYGSIAAPLANLIGNMIVRSEKCPETRLCRRVVDPPAE